MSMLHDMNEYVDKEMRAYQSVMELLEKAKEARTLFEDAGLPIPPVLSRILSDPTARVDGSPKMVVTPPKTPPRPQEAKDDWIWLDASDATPMTLALAILRKHGASMKVKDVFDEITEHQPKVNFGSVMNIGPRLEERQIITRSDEGWLLTDASSGPVLFEGKIWGLPSALGKSEMAAHRRAWICHLLQASDGGLQVVQIVRQLTATRSCQAPLNKDLVKADMNVLEADGKVRRVGNSRKWTLVRKKASE